MENLFEFVKSKIFIIAEAGVNHNGSLSLAKKLIDAAIDAGADAVKFQSFKTEKLVTKTAEKAQYQKNGENKETSQFEMLKKLELSFEDHLELYHYCTEKGIMFLSTPFDHESADMLESLDMAVFKISSGDLTNMPFLKHIGKKMKPVILSTGMADINEVEEAVQWVRETGNQEIIILHCTTDYPAPYEEVNLRAMETMRSALNLSVGYSDHTPGLEIPIAAAAMGARIIEKHFTLDKDMEGPDHKASLDPMELKELVRCVRNIEKALGDGIKKATKSEMKNLAIVRKSIVSKVNIRKGEVICAGNIEIKRPQEGILPKFYNDLVGKKAIKDIEPDIPIHWFDVE